MRVVSVRATGAGTVAGSAVVHGVGVVSVAIVGLVVRSVVDAVSVRSPLVSVVVTGPGV